MPVAPYVSLSEMKVWLGENSTENDEKISGATIIASTLVQSFCERDLASASATETLYGNGTRWLLPRRTPITGVASCLVEGVAVPVSFEPERIKRTDHGVFEYQQAVSVTFTAGYAVLPNDVVHATKLTAQAIYNSPAYDQNFQAENLSGVFSGAYHQFGPSNMPPAARLILETYRARY
jgi:hypothetical protein